MEGTLAGKHRFRLEPRRPGFQLLEEILQDPRSPGEGIGVAFHAGFDQPVRFGGAERRQRVDDRIGHGIADDGLADVACGQVRIEGTRGAVPGAVCDG